jgi:membrane associated rhomboid family serine protease
MRQGNRKARLTDGWVVLSLSLGCAVVLAWLEFAPGQDLQQEIHHWGWHAGVLDADMSRWHISLHAVGASFLHVSWLHLIGNVAFLLLLGPQLERRIGHTSILLVYLTIAGLANSLATWHYSEISEPLVGASGAVAGIMGAYLMHFPNRRIGVYLPLGVYLHPVKIPGAWLIGVWFLLQIGYAQLDEEIMSPLSWRVHVAGFGLGLVFGALSRLLLEPRRKTHFQD